MVEEDYDDNNDDDSQEQPPAYVRPIKPFRPPSIPMAPIGDISVRLTSKGEDMAPSLRSYGEVDMDEALAILFELGTTTVRELADELETSPEKARSLVTQMLKKGYAEEVS